MEKIIADTKKVFSEVERRYGKKVFNSLGAALKSWQCCELLVENPDLFFKCVEVYRTRMRTFAEHYEKSKKNGRDFSREIETALSYKFGKIAPHPEAMWMFNQNDTLALGNTSDAVKLTLLRAFEESSRRTGLAPEFIAACFLSEGGVLIYSKGADQYPYNSVNTYLAGLDNFHELWTRKQVQKWLPEDFGSRFKPMGFMTHNNKQMVRGCDFGSADTLGNYESLVLAFGATLKHFDEVTKQLLPNITGDDLQIMTYLAFNFGENSMQRYVNERGMEWVKKRCLTGVGGFANAAQVMSIKKYLAEKGPFLAMTGIPAREDKAPMQEVTFP